MQALLDWLLDLLGLRPKAVALRFVSAWPDEFQVALIDTKGKRVRKDNIRITARGTGLRLSGRLTERTQDGLATFSNLQVTPAEGDMDARITFSGDGLSDLVSDPITVEAVVAGMEFVTPPPAEAEDEALFPQAVVLQLVSRSGKPVAKAGVEVRATASPGAEIVGEPVAVSDTAGRLTFLIGLDDTGQ